jgi:hypothetical protein
VKKLSTLTLIVLCVAGCAGRDGYLIVSAVPSGENLMSYTIEHKRVTIKAHCQLYDVHNHCAELRAGETYDFKRDDSLRFLTLGQWSDNNSIVLGIDEEHMH